MQYSRMYIFVILQESRKTQERLYCTDQENSCAHTTFCFFTFIKVMHSFSMIFSWKSAEKYAVSDLLKVLFSTKMAPEIRAEIPRTLYVHIQLYCTDQENSCAHTTFCSFNFTNIIDFLSINFFMETCRIVCHFIFSKKVNFAKMAHTTILHWPGELFLSLPY